MESIGFDVIAPDVPDVRGMLFTLDEYSDLRIEFSLLHTQGRDLVTDRNLIVVRLPIGTSRETPLSAWEAEQFHQLSTRFPGKTIAALYSDRYVHQLTDHLSTSPDPEPGILARRTDLIAAMRQQEMEHFALATNALMPKNSGYRYRLPSGVYSDSFLRVGNIQSSRHVLDATFFWMLPHLAGVDGILVDTWSIGSTALNACLRLPRYDPMRRDLRLELLAHYHDMRAGTRRELIALARTVSQEYTNTFLMLFSASMTGESFRRARLAFESDGCPPERLKSLVLYRIGESHLRVNGEPIPELCNFSDHMEAWAERSARDEQGKSSVDIDADTYFPRIVAEETRSITRDVASLNRTFFDEYGDAIRIHADAKVGGQAYRHHGIFIDVCTMLRTSSFRDRLADHIANLTPKPTTIIFPPNDAAEQMAFLIASQLERSGSVRPRLIRSVELQASATTEVTRSDSEGEPWDPAILACGGDAAILIVDDVITTGTRMLTFQQRLRVLAYKGRIQYLVAVARAADPKSWKRLNSTLAANPAGPRFYVGAVEEVTLPDWNIRSCPWCREGEVLDDLLAEAPGEVSLAWQERANTLRNAVAWNGLVDDVFMTYDQDAPMEIGQESFFVSKPATQAAVAAAVASAIQTMRVEPDDGKRLSPGAFPKRSVLMFNDVMDRYTDAILRSAILRTALGNELRLSREAEEDKRADWARKMLTSNHPAERSLRRELLIAVVMDKLPRTTLDQQTLDTLRNDGFAEFCDLFERGRI